jgi:hypothetical protein
MFRAISVIDRPLIDEWIEVDEDHKSKGMTSDFFYEKGRISVVVEDEQGPTMYIRLDAEPPTMRLHIEFCPSKRRVARSLLKSYPKFAEQVKKTGATRMVFDTVNPDLARFCERALGFVHVEGTNDWEVSLKGQDDV